MHIKNVALLFYTGIAILMVLLISQAKVQKDLLESNTLAEVNQTKVEQLNNLLVNALNIETGMRGYLLTRDEKFLDPYHAARAELDKQITIVKELATADEISEFNVIFDLLTERIRSAQNNIKNPPRGEELIFRLQQGKIQMDNLRASILRLITKKDAEQEAAAIANRRYSGTMIWVTIITSLAIFFFMFFASKQVQFEINRRSKSENDLKINLSYLRTLTSSIPAGVMALDRDGKVTFANQRASELLNFNPDRVQGQYFSNLASFSQHERREIDLAMSQGESINRELSMGSNGSRFPSQLHVVPLYQRSELVGSVVTFQDISREKVLQAELVAEKETAISASKAKSAFLSQLSHEFRTPLNAIIGMGDMLLQSSLNTEQHKYASVLSGAAQNLLRLINDVLDLSKIESGKLELDEAPFHLGSVVEECVKIISFKASEKGLTVKLKNNVPQEAFHGDSMRLHQVLMNLLGNALKFTERGSIIVEVREERGMIRFDVTDTGKGISPDKLESIFEKYSQENKSISKVYGGTGLGLAISREIANMMGGNLTASSVLGKGSTFTLTIRLRPHEGIFTTLAPKEIRLNPMKILLVDDNPDNRLVVVSYLKGQPVAITEAADGTEAVPLALKNDYDLILMDMHMPKMDGYEATTRIRAQGSKTPIVALTAYALKEEVTRILSVGCQDRLAKPITRAKLLAYLAQFQEAHLALAPMTQEDEVDETIKGLIPEYIARRRADIPKIRDWVEKRDAASLRALSHNLRGTALSYGQHQLDVWAKNLSIAVQAEDWNQVQKLASEYTNLFPS